MAAAGVMLGCDSGETTDGEGSAGIEIPVEPPSRERAPFPTPTEGRPFAPPPPTVLVSGVTAEGRDSDWVLYGTSKGPCVIKFYPEPRNGEGGGACGEGVIPDRVAGGIDDWGYSSDEGVGSATGFIGPGVDSVRVEFDGVDEVTDEMVAAAWIRPDALQATRSRPPTGFFAAWLPDGVSPDDVTVTALDDQGDEVGATSWPDF